MVGFNYKSLVLQIIHGSILLGTILYVVVGSHIIKGDFISGESQAIIYFSLFILASYVIGVILDFFADLVESLLIYLKMKPPVFFLLTRGYKNGIVLAHHKYILQQLCKVASRYYVGKNNETHSVEWFLEQFARKDRKTINYILQVAKNRAFRKCSEVQKDQIDSFFMLYIFSRNIALGVFLSSTIVFYHFICNQENMSLAWYSLLPFTLSILFVLASYRYYLYYARILLGSSFRIKCA